MNRVSPKPNRRAIFVSALRYMTLGVVAAVGGLTLAKRRRLIEEGICINDGMCQRCLALADCGLPPALSMKDIEQRGDHGRSK